MKEKYKVITSEKNQLITKVIHAIDKNVIKLYNRGLAEYGLTMQQSLVILYIGNTDKEKVYQIDLERYLGLRNPTVTSMIKNLIANDYVYRIKDEADGRYYHLHLTDKSLAVKDNLARVIYEINHKIESQLTEEEFTTLSFLLNKVSEIAKAELSEDQDISQ